MRSIKFASTEEPHEAMLRADVVVDAEHGTVTKNRLGPRLTAADIQLAYHAIGFWSSDYNDAPHDDLNKLRAKLVKMGAKP